MSPLPPRVLRTAVALATAAAGAIVPLSVGVAAAPAAHAETITVSPTGSVLVTARGNGHGHGMSQYGAYGAARKGLSYARILAFYYPGTRLASVPGSVIRVRLSGYPASPSVQAEKYLAVTGSKALPYVGVRRYRLVPSGSGFALQQLRTAAGSTWRTVRTGLPNRSGFWRTNGWSTRLYRADNTSTRFFGTIRSVRSGGGSYPVNRVGIDNYTAGVVPSEMPTSWSPQAVNAQAVAARTYGRYEAVHTPRGAEYDICDTTQCQVYGGRFQYDAAGHLVWSNYQPAAVATSGHVLTYRGATIFSQFSASNGGWTATGDQPYLRAKADPYDAMSANPYINYRQRVLVHSLASYFGFSKLTSIVVTKRDGHGAWGGRVLGVTLRGTAGGRAKSAAISGYDLQWALGLGTNWYALKRA